MGLVRGEDIAFVAEFDREEFDVADIQVARLSIANNGRVMQHGTSELTIDTAENEVRYEISQADSLRLEPNSRIDFELNLLTNYKRHCVVKFSTTIEPTLLTEMLEADTEPISYNDIIDILIQGGSMDGQHREIEYVNNRVQEVKAGCFKGMIYDFKSVTLPNVTIVNHEAFYNVGMESIDMEKCATLQGNHIFYSTGAKKIKLPLLNQITGYTGTEENFLYNNVLEELELGSVLPNLEGALKLTTIILHGFVEPTSASVFADTPFDKNGGSPYDYDGYVYVPSELLSQFANSTAWTNYANVREFRAIEGSEYE